MRHYKLYKKRCKMNDRFEILYDVKVAKPDEYRPEDTTKCAAACYDDIVLLDAQIALYRERWDTSPL